MRPIAGLGEAPLDPVQRLEWCVKAIREATRASHITSALQSVNEDVGEFGAANQTLIVTVDGKGRVTSMQEVSIAIAHGQVSGLGALALLNSVGAAQIDPDSVGTSELANDAAANENLANMAQATIKGRSSGSGTGDPEDLTGTQVAAILPDASESQRGPVEHASAAEIRSAAPGNLAIIASQLETAAALVALTDAATVALDWDTGINFSLTVAGNRTLGNPSNGIPGTTRTIRVQGNDGTDRTLLFDTQYVGPDLTDMDDIDSTKKYLISIYCETTSLFWVSYLPSA